MALRRSTDRAMPGRRPPHPHLIHTSLTPARPGEAADRLAAHRIPRARRDGRGATRRAPQTGCYRLTPSHAFARLRTPSHAFARLRTGALLNRILPPLLTLGLMLLILTFTAAQTVRKGVRMRTAEREVAIYLYISWT